MAEPADCDGWWADPVSMSVYLERVAAADERLPVVETRVALLTGQSSLVSSALSPDQISFLHAVAPEGASVLEMGFPFDSAFQGAGFREMPVLPASWRNARQVWWALRSERFRGAVRRRLEALLASTSRRLILITGSCGLQLANVGWPPAPVHLRVDVVALGPACFGALRVPAVVVQGRADGWSKLLYRGRVDVRCECGHLAYWGSAEVREKVGRILR